MRLLLSLTLAAAMTIAAAMTVNAQEPQIPDGYWTEAQSQAVLDKVETITLSPDLSKLTPQETAALKDLYEAGAIMQKLYEVQKHAEARPALDRLRVLDVSSKQSQRTQNLLSLYRLFHGPITFTLDNRREAFLPVAPYTPGVNMYPADATKEEIDAFLKANPNMRDEILGERTVVRRNTRKSISEDIAPLNAFSLIRQLHPGLYDRLRAMSTVADGKRFYAVPYTVAYADDLYKAYNLLMRAAETLEPSDAEFARYLRNRGRDLVTNDYESGDASWVTGRFNRLNAQIGAYETYDDALYGVKAFHSMSILIADEAATTELRKALGGIQEIEDALPYQSDRRVREDIPVGVYNVVADYGQARGTNTATILPNDALFSRRYGRTILLRQNIMRHPSIVSEHQRVFRAATADAHGDDLKDDGDFLRTLWHEIGHYLGPDRDKQGRTLDVALEEYADATEEMKSDLVSLFALQRMNHPSLRSIQAAGIRRTLQPVKPRRDQPYQTMQLIQFNWFVDKGLLTPDRATGRLAVDYSKYGAAVNSLLTEVLRLQQSGDKTATAKFFDQWTKWGDMHEKLAARVRDAQGARWRIVKYAALGE
jgi:hypothetical protein